MQLDISKISALNGEKIEFEGETQFLPVAFLGNDFTFPSNAFLKGSVLNEDGAFLLQMSVSGKVKTACARCGADVTESFEFDLNEKLIKGGNAADDDAAKIDGFILNLDEFAVNGFLMNSPARYLCSEECKGLCPVCGKNLSEGDCSCNKEGTDPRFDILNNIKF